MDGRFPDKGVDTTTTTATSASTTTVAHPLKKAKTINAADWIISLSCRKIMDYYFKSNRMADAERINYLMENAPNFPMPKGRWVWELPYEKYDM